MTGHPPPYQPAVVGDPVDRVETPALVVDLDRLSSNIAGMAAGARKAGVALRPHAKSHKCAAIARLQVEAGAAGVCCQKVHEAESMAAAGIADIYVSNQIVAPAKLARLARLARSAAISLAFDSPEGVEAAGHAARAAGVELGALVELDLGDERAGVPPDEPTVDLARRIARTEGLRFAGLQAYKSTAQHAPTPDERRRLSREGVAIAHAARTALATAGIACGVVSGGGTGSWQTEAESGVFTEIQPGSYVFMDAYYNRIAGEGGAPFREFGNALFLLATVISAPAAGRALLDAGTKALEFGYAGPPVVWGRPGVEYHKADDEHGRLRWAAGTQALRVGERVRLVPGNCDPTVNLHDWLVGIRSDRVETIWAVDARGPGF